MNANVKTVKATLASGVDPAQLQRAKLVRSIGLVSKIPTVDHVVQRAPQPGRGAGSAAPAHRSVPAVPTIEAVAAQGAQAQHSAPVAPAPEIPPVVARAPTPAIVPAQAPEVAPAKIAPARTTAAKIAPPKAAPAATESPRLNWPIIWTIVVAALILWGMQAHLERYITPQRGIGYWLGIAGGSMMLLLLLYSARKRVSWLRWLGGIPTWFEFHMVLGVVGPVLVLFHSNFHLGATNSNVALFCMLLVAGSGVFGRYVYTRLHVSLDCKEDTLEQMKAVGDRLREQTSSIEFLPGLVDAIEQIEKRWIVPPKGNVARFIHLFTGIIRMARARQLVRRAIKAAVRQALLRESQVIAVHAERMSQVARRYAYRRLDAGRRVSEYQAYAQLFSLWHVLHIPLFFMLLIAGIAHVIAVNVY